MCTCAPIYLPTHRFPYTDCPQSACVNEWVSGLCAPTQQQCIDAHFLIVQENNTLTAAPSVVSPEQALHDQFQDFFNYTVDMTDR